MELDDADAADELFDDEPDEQAVSETAANALAAIASATTRGVRVIVGLLKV
jgi:hypothetical protein